MGCAGCFNPDTHDPLTPDRDVTSLVDELISDDPGPDGLTVTGGEPLQQSAALLELIRDWKARTHTSVIILTGYSWEEIQAHPDRSLAVRAADVVIAGRYNERLRVATGLRGSENKTYHFLTEAYRLEDFEAVPELEVIISPDGTLHVTGVAGSAWLRDQHGP